MGESSCNFSWVRFRAKIVPDSGEVKTAQELADAVSPRVLILVCILDRLQQCFVDEGIGIATSQSNPVLADAGQYLYQQRVDT